MRVHSRPRRTVLLPLLSLLLLGCPGQDRAQRGEVPAQPDGVQPPAAGTTMDREAMERSPLRFELSLSERELYVYRDGQRVETHPVAVGQEEYPTPPGEYQIGTVIWNPEWVPPDEEWAEDRERKAPGDPDNPLGQAQLVYDRPYSIHGTDALQSLGQAASHGSVRVANEVVTDLARQAMEHGGASRPESWYREAQERRTERRVVDLPDPIPLRIYE